MPGTARSWGAHMSPAGGSYERRYYTRNLNGVKEFWDHGKRLSEGSRDVPEAIGYDLG